MKTTLGTLSDVQFFLNGHSHRRHFFACVGIRVFERVSVIDKGLIADIHQILMNIVLVDGVQVRRLIEAIDQRVVKSNAADESVCTSVGGDDEATEFVVGNTSELRCGGIEHWEWPIHYRDKKIKWVARLRFVEFFATRFSEAGRNHQHLIQKISKHVAHLFQFSCLGLCNRLMFLPPWHADRNPQCNQCAECLQPRGQSWVGLNPAEKSCPTKHSFLSKRKILA